MTTPRGVFHKAGFTYRDFRRHQIKTLGVRSPVFASELPLTNRNRDISDLNEEEQQKIMETWVTKQLMQEELDSRSWWSKNIWNRKEAKAMRDYIANANTVLGNANHNGDQEYFENVLNVMLLKGYEKIDDTLEHNMNKFKAEFRVNDSALRELEEKKERLAEEQRLREELEKEEEARRKTERAQKKSDDKKQMLEVFHFQYFVVNRSFTSFRMTVSVLPSY